ncbi:flagellar filament capping protein FliD [Thermoanaerobacterium sp. R66]|uniref:flagellar filament capping protein FliD n=1 Tax=Thermoanaerobacterium sp. R66 TaxID=2742479 RepID=UPI002380A6DD|nr:flagellar filament capping protein FliD [Thermoanaerobacterium sp. R66]MDE4542528.1 flagellar filament capping protein FliD [Thermoanaerobacterium sp. R66]
MDPITMQNSTTSNLLRISGLASGIDTDSIVKQLMTAASQPLYQLEQQKQWLQWQQEDLQDINTKLLTLRDNTLFSMKLQGTYLAKTVSSNTSIATATAGVNAVNGTYQLTVKTLASAATATSQNTINSGDVINDTGNDITLTISNGDANSSATITIKSGQTINDLVTAINSVSNTTHINATYDSNLGRLFLVSSTTGSNSQINISESDTSNTILTKLNLYIQNGNNADFIFNNVEITNSTSNNVTVAGINVNLTGIGSTTLSVQTDTDTIYNSIKSFVDAYNDVITTINSKLTEQRYYDYQPLTDDQKKQMTQDDITAWQQKARSGDLSGNDNLTSIYYSMRNAISGTVIASDGTKMTLSSIGITTGQWYEGGKLYIDDTKLKDAIQKNPQEVMDLFTKITESTTDVNATPGSSQNDGIAARLYYIVNNGINSITKEAGGGQYQLYDNSFLGQQINDLNQRISDMQDHLNTLEQQYYDQFTQLETYMAQMNSQSQWLSQQLSG